MQLYDVLRDQITYQMAESKAATSMRRPKRCLPRTLLAMSEHSGSAGSRSIGTCRRSAIWAGWISSRPAAGTFSFTTRPPREREDRPVFKCQARLGAIICQYPELRVRAFPGDKNLPEPPPPSSRALRPVGGGGSLAEKARSLGPAMPRTPGRRGRRLPRLWHTAGVRSRPANPAMAHHRGSSPCYGTSPGLAQAVLPPAMCHHRGMYVGGVAE